MADISSSSPHGALQATPVPSRHSPTEGTLADPTVSSHAMSQVMA